MLEYSSHFIEFMGRATEAKSHTPWDLLSHQQLRALIQKMADTIKTLRKKVRDFSACAGVTIILGLHVLTPMTPMGPVDSTGCSGGCPLHNPTITNKP
jgi:hypothetical protein